MKIITHPFFFDHLVDSNCLETPDRLLGILEAIPDIDSGLEKCLDGDKSGFVVAAEDGSRFIDLVHPQSYQLRIKDMCQELGPGAVIRYGDNCFSADTYRAACYAVGAAVQAATFAKGNVPSLALVRPPGHHAHTEQYSGFCVFNNIAIATAYLLGPGNEKKVLILDVDLHHGDGTAEYVSGKKSTCLVSIGHESLWPHLQSDAQNVHLIGLSEGSCDDDFIGALHEGVKRRIDEFNPDIIAVSFGTDGHGRDGARFSDAFGGRLALTDRSYKTLWKFLNQTCIPYFGVLEGGYTNSSLVDGIYSFIRQNTLK